MTPDRISDRSSRWRAIRPENLLPDVFVVALCLLAFIHGVQSTSGFEWPGEADKSRDIGQAQTMLDGNLLGDSQYVGEMLWYNPLTPALVAVTSRVLNLPVYLVYTRAGAYFDLLVPVCFYWLAARLVGRWAAAGGTLGLLFIPPASDLVVPFPSYSPWLYSRNLAYAWFLLTLLVYLKARAAQRRRWLAATGLLLGITFLAHTAPALILGLIFVGMTVIDLRRLKGRRLGYMTDLGIILIVALLVSAPLVYSIVVHYHFQILNTAPGSYLFPPLQLKNLSQFIVDGFLSQWPFWITVLGFIGLSRERANRPECASLLLWLAISFGLLAYSYIWQAARTSGVSLPNIVPSFHFLLYLWLAGYVLFGYGLFTASHELVGVVNRLWRRTSQSPAGPVRIERTLLGLGLLAVLAGYYPQYPQRPDFVEEETLATEFGRDTDTINAYHWTRLNTLPSDVFLSSERLAMFVVTPAGRKLVAGDRGLSNPYVDWKLRATDRDMMFGQLVNNQPAEFCVLAAKYNTKYVIAGGNLAREIEAANLDVVHKELMSGRIGVYRVLCP